MTGTPGLGPIQQATSIAAAGAVQSLPLRSTGAASGSVSAPFADLVTAAVNQTASLESEARSAVQGLMTGTGVDIHQAMIASEKASMAFEMALSVRNKAVQAYQQVMSLQF